MSNPSNYQSASGRLQEAFEELLLSWSKTREVWSDQQAQNFEETFLDPISQEVTAALPVISQMSQIVGAARRDCTE